MSRPKFNEEGYILVRNLSEVMAMAAILRSSNIGIEYEELRALVFGLEKELLDAATGIIGSEDDPDHR